jgi:hypothetical protein
MATNDSPNNDGKRRAVTPEEKAHQRTLAKVKRLNTKLSKIKAISINMSTIATRNNAVSSRQVEAWSKQIRDILNVRDDV